MRSAAADQAEAARGHVAHFVLAAEEHFVFHPCRGAHSRDELLEMLIGRASQPNGEQRTDENER
uniref:Uncharacterized protein n=1 Tax=mine drainage metagenome TaxID=410659 RepID=E6PZN7_9ZZZZ